ncbi:MAG: siphovirus Gp157 family protein [Patescibacteria group bacterium]|nr:siphovirus Gp157 family protein [Patescibacteria group bacterium]
MNITLYKAAADVRELLDQIDPETGEMPEGYEQARALVATKAQAVAAFILENDAQADMVESHAKELMARVKTARRRSDWLKEYLKSHMAACGITSIKSDDGTFSAKLEMGRDESVDVFESALLPNDYLREVPAKYEPDKALIKKAIKEGFDVPGARLVAKDRLTIK